MKKSETFVEKPADPFPGISAEEALRAEANVWHVDGFNGPVVVCLLNEDCLRIVLSAPGVRLHLTRSTSTL